MRRYVQTPGPIGEFSELSLRQRAGPLDLVYMAYGLLGGSCGGAFVPARGVRLAVSTILKRSTSG